jgi:hypothetical protein
MRKNTEPLNLEGVDMSICPSLDPKTIRLRCEFVRSRWDSTTAARRRAAATAMQRELAQQLGLASKPAEDLEVTRHPPMAGVA